MYSDLKKIFFKSKSIQLYAILIVHRIICLSQTISQGTGVCLSKKFITNTITGDQKTSKKIVDILCKNQIIQPINDKGLPGISYQKNFYSQRYISDYHFSGKLIQIDTEDFIKSKNHEKFIERYTKRRTQVKWH